MPLYEYKCEKCDAVFEILQRSNEKVKCPTCGTASLQKLFSTFAKGGASGPSSHEGSMPASAPGSCGTGCCGMNRG